MNLWEEVWPALAAAGIVMVVFFLVHLCATPYRMAKAAETTHDDELRQVRLTYDAELSRASAALVAEQSRHAETRTRLEQVQVELQRAKSEPVSHEHFEELRIAIGTVRDVVDTNRQIKSHLAGSDRRSVVRHFPDLSASFDAWDAALQYIYDRTDDLEYRLTKEALARAIVPPVFVTEVLLRVVQFFTTRRADFHQLDLPFDFGWREVPEGDLSGAEMAPTVYMTDVREPVLHTDRAEGSLTAVEAESIVESLFLAAQTWPETLAYESRDEGSGWPELKGPLLDRLSDLLERHNYKRGNGCPRCD